VHILQAPAPSVARIGTDDALGADVLKFVKDLAWNTAKKFQADNCPQLAASITYYVIFSTFPVLIFVAGAIGLFLGPVDQREIIREVLKTIPFDQADGGNTVENAVKAISGSKAPLITIVGLAGMAWGGSGMFTAVRRALNIVYREPEYNRPWFWQKVVDLSLVLGIGVFFTSSVAVSAILRVTNDSNDIVARVALALVEYVVPFVFSFIAFIVLYTIVPSRNRNLGNAWPGALVAAILFEVVKFGFSFYVTNFKNFDLVFGSLGALATFMFWVYMSSQIMLFGAEIATTYPLVRDQKYNQPRLAGMGVSFQTKVYRTVRRLFVQDKHDLTKRD
jgi:membrane protein